ncbi:plastocyanin/azurin family copper-binding protein [Salinigranum halophilum]|jgi:plastocyanin|uniref:plastocyanin/azurin family copper-binding protein n=1 Tax=Salinigranum halophilum TaxID=2565931 RepID=UPI0010A8AFE9|nr:plastocyanin/azurin family copper-binding protein [Salinigranum halophilum]
MSRFTDATSRRRVLGALGAAGVSSLAGCTALVTGGSGGEFDVGMTAAAFNPPQITVQVGEEVVWHNTSARGHTVTAYENAIPDDAVYFASGGFASESEARDAWQDRLGGKIDSGESYSHTFEVPGRYDYVCLPHEPGGMIGSVIVEE